MNRSDIRIIDKTELDAAIGAIGIAPNGNRIVIATGHQNKPSKKTQGQWLHIGELTKQAKFKTRTVHSIPDPQLDKNPKSLSYLETRLGLTDDRIAVVARVVRNSKWQHKVEVVRVDLKTGKTLSRLLEDKHVFSVTGVVAASAKYVFVGLPQAVICLDVATLEEVCRTPEFDLDGVPLQEDVFGEEAIAPGGFAYHTERRLLYTAPGYYNAGVIYCYKFDEKKRCLQRQWRREVVENRPTRREAELLSIRAISSHPDGKEVAAVFELEDLRIDLWGQPITDREQTLAAAVQSKKENQRIATPKTARLGWLGLFSKQRDDWIELQSEMDRDVTGGEQEDYLKGNKPIKVGYCLATKGPWESTPFYLDQHRVVLVTPSGLIQVADVRSGEVAAEHDLRATVAELGDDSGPKISALAHQADANCLLVGLNNGTLLLVELGSARGEARVERKHDKRKTVGTQTPPLSDTTHGSEPRHAERDGHRKRTIQHPKRRQSSKPPVVELSDSFSLLATGFGDSGVAITEDGRVCATGTFVWDVEHQKSLAVMEYHGGSVALTRDGQQLFSGAGDGTVSYWDVASGRLLWRVKSGWENVHAVALSPNGSIAASGHSSGAIRIWNVETGKRLAVLDGHKMDVQSVAFSPDGNQLVSGSRDKTIRIWDLTRQKSLFQLRGHIAFVTGVAWTLDGRHIVSASHDKTIRVWDASSRKCLRVLKGHTKPIVCLAVTRNGKQIVSGSMDKTVRVWNVEKGRSCINKLPTVSEPVGVTVSGNGLVVASLATEQNHSGVQMWNLETGEDFGRLGEWQTEVNVGLGSDGKLVYSQRTDKIYVEHVASKSGQRVEKCLIDSTFSVWDVEKRTRVASYSFTGEGGRSEGNQWGAIAEGPRVALFSEYNDGDHQIFVWKFDGRRAPQILTNTEGGKTAVVVTPDARTAISGHVDHVCRVWDLARGRLRSRLAGHSQIVTKVAISRDGRRALSGSDDESVRMWDLADASCLCVFNGHSRAITAVELNPDSTVAASGSEDGNIYLWDTETGKVTGELDSPTKQSVHGLRFNADGSRLATVHWESIRLWDVATGQALAQFQHEGHYPTQVAFLEDEGVLISLSRSVIRRWRLPG